MKTVGLLVINLILFFLPLSVIAEDAIEIPGWSGFTSGAVQGIPLENGKVDYSSAVIAEIDGNTENGKEVAVGGADGYLYVYGAEGTLRWSYALPNANCSKTGSTNKLFSSPSVGELFGDGVPYVVVGYGGVGGAECGGGVVAINGTDGSRRWHFNIKRFTKKNRIWAAQYGVFGSPALADVNGDGVLEIGFGSFDRGVYLLDARGKPVWRYNAADTVWSSPAFYNVKGKRKLEMIVATDISGNNFLNPPTEDGGILYALKTKGVRRQVEGSRWRRKRFTDYEFRNKRLIVWQRPLNQTLMSSPVVADLLPDNPGMEVVVASGCYFPEGSTNKRGKWIKIVDARTGELLNTLQISACSPSSVAVGDIDEDGLLEIVATVNGSEAVGGDGDSRVMAFNPDESQPFWTVIPNDRYGNHEYGGHFMSPVIADVDGNGSLEVLVPNSRSVGVYAGKTGAALSCQENSCDDLTEFRTGSTLFSTPAIGDLDNDGLPELVIGGARGSSGALFGWTNLHDVISSQVGIHESYHSPWPMHRGNAHRSGTN